MMPMKSLTDKKNIFAAAVIAGLVVLCASSIYFGLQTYKLSLLLGNQKMFYEKMDQETAAFRKNYDKLQSDYTQLKIEDAKLQGEHAHSLDEFAKLRADFGKMQSDFTAASEDRANLLNEIKSLMDEKNRARGLEAALEKSKKDMAEQDKERARDASHMTVLQNKIRDLGTIQRQLIVQKEQLEDNLSKATDVNLIRNVEQTNSSLQNENTLLSSGLKEAKMQIAGLKDSQTKLTQELNKANEKAQNFNKMWLEAMKKNKAFERQLVELPTKFAEVSRQNKALIRQTATMHYNLGVFYTKQKDFERAAMEFEKAVELTPDDGNAHFNLGYIYAEHLVNREKAIKHFQQYLRCPNKDPKDVDWVKKYILTWQSWNSNQPME